MADTSPPPTTAEAAQALVFLHEALATELEPLPAGWTEDADKLLAWAMASLTHAHLVLASVAEGVPFAESAVQRLARDLAACLRAVYAELDSYDDDDLAEDEAHLAARDGA